MDNNELDTIREIADYQCRKYYEMLLEALIIIVVGTIIGVSVSKIAPTTSTTPVTTTTDQSPQTEQNIPQGKWVKPLDRMNRTSPFGMRWHPVLGGYRMHNGVDYSGTTGTPLYSMSNGVVLRTISDSACGLGAVISHGEGITSHYCHLSKVSVRTGEKLKPGQRIGDVGNTGRSTGPHLHLGIKRNGSWINPETFMKSKGII